MADLAALLNHAVARHRAGARAEAAAAYRAVLAQAPEEPNALHLLGLLLCEDGAAEAGLALIGRARERHPTVAAIAFNLGNVLLKLERPAAALAEYDAAVALDPGFASAWRHRAQALLALDRAAEALPSAEAGLALAPHDAGLHVQRGLALQALGETAAALASLDAALALAPDDPEVHAQRAAVLFDQGAWPQALAGFEAALDLQPDHVFTLYNLARAHQELGRPQQALPYYDRALQAAPGHAPSAWNRQMCHLLMGDYRHWPDQWGEPLRTPRRTMAMPRWSGDSLAGRRILLHIDHGLGDTLQVCRFVPRVIESAAQVVLEVQAPLVRLLRRSFPATVIAQGDWHAPVHCHRNLMDLPGLFGVTLGTLPGRIPYLRAEPAAWRERLAGLPGRRIGLVWAGAAREGDIRNLRMDRRRSMPAHTLAPLAGMAGIHLISLQKGPPAGQAGAIPGLIDWTGALQDFADTADLVAGLDLVISVDTSTAHLAGALGVPVWLLNRFDPCWRWGLERDDSPWYPNLRQFRQTRPGDWDSVIGRVIQALREPASPHRARA